MHLNFNFEIVSNAIKFAECAKIKRTSTSLHLFMISFNAPFLHLHCMLILISKLSRTLQNLQNVQILSEHLHLSIFSRYPSTSPPPSLNTNKTFPATGMKVKAKWKMMSKVLRNTLNPNTGLSGLFL